MRATAAAAAAACLCSAISSSLLASFHSWQLGVINLPTAEGEGSGVRARHDTQGVPTCRYKADLSTRGSRLQDLQDKWFKQQNTKPGAVPAEQRDMVQATAWFEGLGWDLQDGESCFERWAGEAIARHAA